VCNHPNGAAKFIVSTHGATVLRLAVLGVEELVREDVAKLALRVEQFDAVFDEANVEVVVFSLTRQAS
jgi:hypothetical protein